MAPGRGSVAERNAAVAKDRGVRNLLRDTPHKMNVSPGRGARLIWFFEPGYGVSPSSRRMEYPARSARAPAFASAQVAPRLCRIPATATPSMAMVSGAVGPLDTAMRAFAQAAAPIEDYPDLARARWAIISSSPDLRERDLAKMAAMSEAVADALASRGIRRRAARAQSPVSVSARAGHIATARRTSAASSGGGVPALTTTTPSSSSWSKTSGAVMTHWPELTQLPRSACTLIC